jgi:hypothetical protein
MKKHKKILMLLLALVVLAQAALAARAQTNPSAPPLPPDPKVEASCVDGQQPGVVCLPSPSGIVELWDLYGRIFSFARFIAAAIFVIMILMGAFKMLLARDNEKQFKDGINTIKYAVIGAAVIMVASGIISVIREFLSK